jgi:GTP cyclohydrolase II
MKKQRPMSDYQLNHIVLTSHPLKIFKEAPLIHWGASSPLERGPLVGTLTQPRHRNVIGTHGGSYGVYRALAQASGDLRPDHRPDLTNTNPVESIGPYSSWMRETTQKTLEGEGGDKIVSLDPWGAMVADVYQSYLQKGYDIRPTIAVTKAHIRVPEVLEALQKKRLRVDGKIVKENGDVCVTKAAIEPVWYLPGVAKRFQIEESHLRKCLFHDTGGMFPELVTRFDLKVFLPPIGSTSVYFFGDPQAIAQPEKELTVRIHDECNGSDVFGSDICTCRPYLIHGIEECIHTAQRGGSGMIVYFRKEGRALGEVTKFLVYNARKRQEGGDSAANYFKRTECVAGVEDMRFQELMPDVLHWVGVKKIDQLVSMSDMKYRAIVDSGIMVKNRLSIPKELIPEDAQVEMEAKKAAGYFTEGEVLSQESLTSVKGRTLHD